jgi:hypothetical protein
MAATVFILELNASMAGAYSHSGHLGSDSMLSMAKESTYRLRPEINNEFIIHNS